MHHAAIVRMKSMMTPPLKYPLGFQLRVALHKSWSLQRSVARQSAHATTPNAPESKSKMLCSMLVITIPPSRARCRAGTARSLLGWLPNLPPRDLDTRPL